MSAVKSRRTLVARPETPKTETEGLVNQVAGVTQDLYGQARDTVADAASAAQETTATLENWFHRTVETQPYTTALVAIGVGWLLGRMHRPF
jgi:hypothetical protein